MLHRIALAISITLLIPSARPQSLPGGIKKVTAVEGITEYALPNGLRVLLFPDETKPKVTVNITYLVGSRHEGYGEGGMAHLLEHLLFHQTATRKSIKQELTDHGAVRNGTTWVDRTNYFETLTASDENLQFAIELEADRMINAKVEKSILDTEMTVVRNEFERKENNPEQILIQRVLAAAYTAHNYSKPTIGIRSDIENVPIERLAAFYRKYYQPDNAVLAIAGKFDEAKALAMITKAFSPIPRPQRTLDKTYTVEPTQEGEREVTLRRAGDGQTVMAVYHVPAAGHPDAPVLDVLASVLGDNPSGRLYKSLVDNKKAVSAGMFMASMHDPGYILASARLGKDQPLEDAKKALITTVEAITKEPASKEEVERAKTNILKQVDLALADPQSVCMILSETLAAGDWRLLFYDRDRLRKVTEQDVARVAKAYLKPSNRTIGSFIPSDQPDRAEIPATPDLSALLKDYKGSDTVSQGEAFDPTPENIERRLTRSPIPGGPKVVLLSKKNRGGTVTAWLTFRFGDPASLRNKAAIAQLTGSLLMRGTNDKSRQQIQDEMNRLKAQMTVTGSGGSAVAVIETVEANLHGALRLAAEILQHPAFPDNQFDQVRQQHIAAIERGRNEPQMVGSRELLRALSAHSRGDIRYVSSADEQVEDLNKVTLDEVRKFHSQFYGASQGEIVITGQFNAPETTKLLTGLFSNWKSRTPYQTLADPYHEAQPATKTIETPDKQSANFVAGHAVKLSDEDAAYPAMTLANYLFGGGSAGRLYKRIRDKEGLSYGIGCQFTAQPKLESAMFLCDATSAPQNTPKLEASFRDEVARAIKKDGFTAEEVDAAKKAYLQVRKTQLAQDQMIARVVATRERYDRTMKFDAAFESKIAALTADQVSDAFRRLIDASALSVVRVGDFKKAGVLQP